MTESRPNITLGDIGLGTEEKEWQKQKFRLMERTHVTCTLTYIRVLLYLNYNSRKLF